jgi:alpha-tubulin suppressor-like RCC1 family protein
MTRNTFGTVAMSFAMAVGLLTGLASTAAAQRQLFFPPPGVTLTPPDPNELVEITGGAFHTCVRKFGGAVYCWGLDASGQVGINAVLSCRDTPVQNPKGGSFGPPTYQPCVDRPTYVTQLSSSGSQIAAGLSHTCALSGGVASCWGSNSLGELGDGTQNPRSLPQNVMGAPIFKRLSAGYWSTCAVGSSGAHCWGSQPYDPNAKPNSLTPKQLFSWNGFTNVTVGNGFVCFVYVSGSWGELDCQGVDNHGQLGDPSWMPRDSNGVPFINTTVGSPIAYGSVLRASAGPDYVCADISNGTVQCVGSNSSGKLGLGMAGGDSIYAVQVNAPSGVQLHGVTAGSDHACALDASGFAWCWGLGRYGELGNGTTGYSNSFSTAQQVSGSVQFRSLAAGSRHTCGIATDNSVYCWGDNEYGQLGVGYNNLGFSGFNYTTYIGTPQHVPAF